MAHENLGELWIALGYEDREGMSRDEDHQTRQPHLQTQTDGCGERAIDDGNRAWRSREKNRFGQRAVKGYLETLLPIGHESNAPPANEKNDRKKLDASKAIESPKTI